MPKSLPWLDPPPAAPFAQAQDLLKRLEALDAEGKITAMGKQMVRLPLHPRLAHMVVKGRSTLAADLAALLSERDGLPRDVGVDITARLSQLRGGARDRIRQTAKQIRQIAGIGNEESDVSPGVLVAWAFPDRIAQRRGGDRRYRLSGGGGAVLPEHDALMTQDFLAVATTDGASGDQKIFLAAPLSLKEIEEHFGDQIEAARRRVLGQPRQGRQRHEVPPPRRAGAGGAALHQRRPRAHRRSDDGGRARHGARRAALDGRCPHPPRPRHVPPPPLSGGGLAGSFGRGAAGEPAHWLTPYLAGISRKAHLDRLDMHQIIQSMIPHDLARKMDRLAPVRIEVPSGADVRIDYETEGDPVLRVRLQEMFGLARTPAIAEGRSPLRIELLSPAGRPLAVTQSLETFWTNGYPPSAPTCAEDIPSTPGRRTR